MLRRESIGQFCECGCGEWTNPGCRFINGHNARIKGGERSKNISKSLKKKYAGWRSKELSLVYDETFDKEMKETIRERDQGSCQLCGKKESIEVILYGTGEKLDVHHIDYDKDNSNPMNLISLCKECHGKTSFDRDYWQKYFTEMLVQKRV